MVAAEERLFPVLDGLLGDCGRSTHPPVRRHPVWQPLVGRSHDTKMFLAAITCITSGWVGA
jgi:hypothetical protein